MKTVQELCKQIKGIYTIDGNSNTTITGISSDSRDIQPDICLSALQACMLTVPSLQLRP